jgi:putative membrane protein insertion efficiency factor
MLIFARYFIFERMLLRFLRFLSWPFIVLVIIYQKIISPLFPPTCRFTPTCSTYFIEALKEWGIINGMYLGVKRILKCNPYGGCGHDPVPKRSLKN